MKNRIREIRLEHGLSQADFGSKISVQQGTVAGYENGSRIPIDAIINLICREFNVNEHWLRTGEGEKTEPRSRDNELSDFLGDVLKDRDNFRRRFIASLAVLSVDDWEALEKIAAKLLKESKKADP